jgi:hypothetical protein
MIPSNSDKGHLILHDITYEQAIAVVTAMKRHADGMHLILAKELENVFTTADFWPEQEMNDFDLAALTAIKAREGNWKDNLYIKLKDRARFHRPRNIVHFKR